MHVAPQQTVAISLHAVPFPTTGNEETMKIQKKTVAALFAAVALTGACDKDGANEVVSTAPAMKVVAPPALGLIDTGGYVMTLHRAIPFQPKTKTAGLKPRNGYRYVVLDISMKNKGGDALDMGKIMKSAKITDQNGKSYRVSAATLQAYNAEYPDPRQQAEYDALQAAAFKPGETHRALVLGLELPADVKALVLSLPVGAGSGASPGASPGAGDASRRMYFPVI